MESISDVEEERTTEDMIKETLELVRILSRIPVKFFPVEKNQSMDFEVLSLLNDLGKHDDSFQQFAGRLSRKKDEDSED